MTNKLRRTRREGYTMPALGPENVFMAPGARATLATAGKWDA